MARFSSRIVAVSAALALPATLLLVGVQPAEAAMTTQTATCVDGGGVRWTAKAVWGASYVDAARVRRTSIDDLSWTTTGAKVKTDSKVRSYDGSGKSVGSVNWSGTFDYRSGRTSKTQNPWNPATTGKPRITLTVGLAGDGRSDCTVTFTQPTQPVVKQSVSDRYEADVITATNRERTSRKLTALKADSCLDRYAEAQAARMAAQKKMYHQDVSKVLKACKMYTVGENVGYGFPSGATVTQAWMNSPSHRANLLTAKYRLIGVGAVQADNGVWYSAQVFGARP